ncbi:MULTISPECIES: S26 family signal peptidase [unclassified Novosphingobium]|uniref:S26 family signal peptidase n=1 Tax=unclassified Novosphingobium TaxID=2644732 RepID=UPI00086ECD12|nr:MULTISPECIES: S26 family signal peptidase [unclassified Novosphingobium]ODU77536.1 MAG: type VI secretion protein [Novosphingobium sp. SCN 63-17]OJX88274.1 MAG: type VI secretion protein [Novosphingobium sp. 63-713]
MSSLAEPISLPVSRRWRRRLLALALVGASLAAWQGLRDWSRHHGLFINASASLPNWAFLVELGRFPARGDVVLFDPGRDPLVVRHFGAAPRPFAKIAYGLPGDLITRHGEEVAVNGLPVARLKPFTRQGEALIPGPLGVVPRGCVFAASPHRDGFDSRYAVIGFVCRDRLLGTGKAIL